MGCSSSKPTAPARVGPDGVELSYVKWKVKPSQSEAKTKFLEDGTLNIADDDPGHLELRLMLDDPVSQNALGKFAEDGKEVHFMCWIDIQEFKSIPTDNYRRSKALHIYNKYLDPTSALTIGELDSKELNDIKAGIDACKLNSTALTPTFYDSVQATCFGNIYFLIYQPFKKTRAYDALADTLTNNYNRVKVTDFEYYSKLGEGGFGFVVHVKKKSTGRHYAMKIQTKKGLLHTHRHHLHKIDYEKKAFSVLHHPFVVSMDYAFHTDALAIMVLGLSTGGDLKQCLASYEPRRMPVQRVRFYVAEIVLALSYLHSMRLIYRDLKPQNILLGADGHVQLADMGGVMDETGLVLGQSSESAKMKMLPLWDSTQDIKPAHVKDAKPSSRRFSILGTMGYMAPEMVVMMNRRKDHVKGPSDVDKSKGESKQAYNNSVDWWSLGITMYRLLTGHLPFDEKELNVFDNMCTAVNLQDQNNVHFKQYASLFQIVSFPEYVGADSRDIIARLLDVNEKTRLGSGPSGEADLKAHPFFDGIDWDQLEQKQIEPPVVPGIPDQFKSEIPFPDLQSMLKFYNKEQWMTEAPKSDYQYLFNTWNFTSPHSIRVESGLANVMEQYDRNDKVRRIMGEEQDNVNLEALTEASNSERVRNVYKKMHIL